LSKNWTSLGAIISCSVHARDDHFGQSGELRDQPMRKDRPWTSWKYAHHTVECSYHRHMEFVHVPLSLLIAIQDLPVAKALPSHPSLRDCPSPHSSRPLWSRSTDAIRSRSTRWFHHTAANSRTLIRRSTDPFVFVVGSRHVSQRINNCVMTSIPWRRNKLGGHSRSDWQVLERPRDRPVTCCSRFSLEFRALLGSACWIAWQSNGEDQYQLLIVPVTLSCKDPPGGCYSHGLIDGHSVDSGHSHVCEG